ncbi:hypothetical protein [Mannheimia pernigra]|uniref:hypothetical protein n=1 Tax=Mannheimia pernigra TaxID=111844 RepID=UPI00159F48C0|nr:hypothetical protein [Mannheimia pernigra]QLB44790.1 hypothetical protein HV561_08565 [Mannheimia pernigra]
MTKFIEKVIEDQNTGADVKYHEITAYSVDFKYNFATVTIDSYISKKTKESGKAAVGAPTILHINNVPPTQECIIDWLCNQLIQAVPDDFQPQNYDGYVNPYMFSGGKVKDKDM